MNDAIVISDIHLGSNLSQTDLLHEFLHEINKEIIKTKNLVINGDLFDSMNLNRLNKGHWQILSDIRKISDHVKVVVNLGNHDGDLTNLSSLTGFQLTDYFIFTSNNIPMLTFHGDIFDNFISKHPILTNLADFSYNLLQKLDKSFYIAKQAKRASKTFLRCSEIIEQKAIQYAKKLECKNVFCGHTHLEMEKQGEIGYFNSGCWTELPCHFVTVKNGIIKLNKYN